MSRKIQGMAIHKYKINFTKNDFFSKIAQDIDLVNKINEVVNNFNMHIDYVPRIKNEKDQWIIDTVYLPIYK